ncbi:MAG TPA: chorismate mutase [Chloroflexota bacterium]
MRALRGAITVDENSAEAIGEATQALLACLAERNNLRPEQVVSVFFTLTPDLNASFPARAARDMGWDVPMLDMQEIDVPGSLARCLRVLVHVDTEHPVRHAYLRGALTLRPELESPGGAE